MNFGVKGSGTGPCPEILEMTEVPMYIGSDNIFNYSNGFGRKYS